MTIAQLTKSDTGWYWCGLDVPSSPTLYKKTEIVVVDGELQLNHKNVSGGRKKSFTVH